MEKQEMCRVVGRSSRESESESTLISGVIGC